MMVRMHAGRSVGGFINEINNFVLGVGGGRSVVGERGRGGERWDGGVHVNITNLSTLINVRFKHSKFSTRT